MLLEQHSRLSLAAGSRDSRLSVSNPMMGMGSGSGVESSAMVTVNKEITTNKENQKVAATGSRKESKDGAFSKADGGKGRVPRRGSNEGGPRAPLSPVHDNLFRSCSPVGPSQLLGNSNNGSQSSRSPMRASRVLSSRNPLAVGNRTEPPVDLISPVLSSAKKRARVSNSPLGGGGAKVPKPDLTAPLSPLVESRLQQLRDSLFSKASGDLFDDDVDSYDETTHSTMKQEQLSQGLSGLGIPGSLVGGTGLSDFPVAVASAAVDESCLVLYTDVHPGSPDPAVFGGADAGTGMDVSVDCDALTLGLDKDSRALAVVSRSIDEEVEAVKSFQRVSQMLAVLKEYVARSKARRDSMAPVTTLCADAAAAYPYPTSAAALLLDQSLPLEEGAAAGMEMSMSSEYPPSPYNCLGDTSLIVDSMVVGGSDAQQQGVGSDADDGCFVFGTDNSTTANNDSNDNDNDDDDDDNDNDIDYDNYSSRSEGKWALNSRGGGSKDPISDLFTVPSGPVKAVSLLAKQYLAQIPQLPEPAAADSAASANKPNPALEREQRLMQLLAQKEQECAQLRSRLQEKDVVVRVLSEGIQDMEVIQSQWLATHQDLDKAREMNKLLQASIEALQHEQQQEQDRAAQEIGSAAHSLASTAASTAASAPSVASSAEHELHAMEGAILAAGEGEDDNEDYASENGEEGEGKGDDAPSAFADVLSPLPKAQAPSGQGPRGRPAAKISSDPADKDKDEDHVAVYALQQSSSSQGDQNIWDMEMEKEEERGGEREEEQQTQVAIPSTTCSFGGLLGSLFTRKQ